MTGRGWPKTFMKMGEVLYTIALNNIVYMRIHSSVSLKMTTEHDTSRPRCSENGGD